jgi:hypothetical protein
MKTIHNIEIAIGVLCIAILAASCVPESQTMGDAGQTLVKLYPGGFKLVAFDAKSISQSALLFEVRRDVNNEAALNSTTTVELTLDQAVLDAYNTANGTHFVLLPTNLGTTNPTVTSGKMTITFSPGEFAKSIVITCPNTNGFDFSKSYAFGFKVTSVSGTGTLSQAVSDKVVAQVLVKNAFDGKYLMKGFIMRPGDTGGLEGYFKDFKHTLSTSGAKSVKMSPNQLWANGGGVAGIGTWEITVNDAGTPPWPITVTDPVAVNWLMDPTYPNRYDPAKKTFYFKVNWGATIPYIRGCTDTLVYSGPSK